MKVTMKALEDFMAFTYLFRFCRPKHEDFFVYEVDAGTPADYNLVLKAMKAEDEELTGDPVEMIIVKEWVLESLEGILASVPNTETVGS